MKTATPETRIPEALMRAAAEAERRQEAALNRVLAKLADQRRTETEDKP